MSDDPSSPQPPAASPADAVRPDLHSRIERRLWLLSRGADRAEARMTVKFGRREFRVYVNGELLWSRNYALEDAARFDADAAAKHAEFTGSGWDVL
ncbi:MAG: hypothetical protein AB7U83_06905 [Vicinamibacterales bacterium]